MAFKDITPGDKTGKAVGMRVIESSKGSYAIEVEFEFVEMSTGSVERLARQFWLTEAALDRTMKDLVEVLGYNGSEATDANGIFTDPNVINFEKEVKLVVEMEPNEDGSKVYPKIKWVNNIGGSQFAGVEVQKVQSKFKDIGFKAAFLSAKQGAKSGGGPGFDKKEKMPW